jgi:hypothetical protein
MPGTAGLSILIFFGARLTSVYSKGRFKSTSSLGGTSASRTSFALDGVGTIREEGGETESSTGTLDVELCRGLL